MLKKGVFLAGLFMLELFALAPRVPFFFEPNLGQSRQTVLYIGRGSGYQVDIEACAITFRTARSQWRIDFPGMRAVKPQPEQRLASFAHHYETLPRPITSLPNYAQLRLEEVYPGIDLVLYGRDGNLEYDFVIRPGFHVSAIRLRFEGVTPKSADDGSIVLETEDGVFRHFLPRAYEEGPDGVRDRKAALLLDGGEARLVVEGWKGSTRLTVDPTVAYAGRENHNFGDGQAFVAFDPSGNMFLSGEQGASETFVVKLSPAGVFQWIATFNGDPSFVTVPLATDTAGNVYLADSTQFAFTATPGAFSTSPGGGRDGYVVKLPPQGAPIAWATLLGGSGDDKVNSIAVDTEGNVYVAGETASSNFPTTTGAYDRTLGGSRDAFALKLKADGSALLYSTLLGGSSTDSAKSISITGNGTAFVVIDTASSDCPVTLNAYRSIAPGSGDVYVVKLNPAGSGLLYATYVGGSAADDPWGSGADELGRLTLGGDTRSPDLPVTPSAVQSAYKAGSRDGFIARLNSAGTASTLLTYLGSTADDRLWEAKPGPGGHVYAVGTAAAGDLPTTDGGFAGGSTDGFLSVLNPLGTAMVYSRYFGGSDHDTATDLKVDAVGSAYIAGTTSSANFPVTPGAPSMGTGALIKITDFNIVPCDVSLTPAARSFPSAGGNDSITVTAGCKWYAIASAPWITLTSSTATGNANITFTVQPNNDATPRAGVIEVNGSLVQIIEQGTATAAPFTDVPSGHAFVDYIRLIQSKAITSGCTATTYCPDAPTTRGQMAVFIVRVMMGGENFPFPNQPYFEDVPANHQFFKYIQVMKQFGITSGCAATRYCPDDPVTRGQMSVFMVRARIGNTFSTSQQRFFDDVAPSHQFFQFVQEMRQDAITTGCDATRYCPDDPVTRGQMAVFLTRAFLGPW